MNCNRETEIPNQAITCGMLATRGLQGVRVAGQFHEAIFLTVVPGYNAGTAITGRSAYGERLSGWNRFARGVTGFFEAAPLLGAVADKFRGIAAKTFDWNHIFENHAPWERVAQQSGRKDIFYGMTAGEIRRMVQAAWKERKLITRELTPVEKGGIGFHVRAKYGGVDPKTGQLIEFRLNESSKTVESAYPKRGR